MRIDYIEAINFFNHSHTILDFTEIDSPTLISGSNGTGKSSIMIETLTFCLFGETRLNSLDDVIRNEENQTTVKIRFNLNGQEVEIVRSKKRGKTQKLSLSIDGNPVEELLSELQKRINSLLNLSFEAFRSSIFLKQDDANFFLNAKADERKQIISEILDLNQYERLEKIARDKRTEAKSNIKIKQSTLQNMEVLDEKQIQNNLKDAELVIQSRGKKITELEEKLELLREYNAKIIEQQKRIKSIKDNNNLKHQKIQKHKLDIESDTELIELSKAFLKENALLDYEDLQKDLINIQSKIDKSKESLNSVSLEYIEVKRTAEKEINSKIDLIKPEYHEQLGNIKSIEKNIAKLASLKHADCPTCLRPLSSQELVSMDSDFSKQKQDIQITLDKLSVKIKKLEEQLSNIEDDNFPQADKLNKQKSLLQQTIKELQSNLNEKNVQLQSAIKLQKNIALAQQKIENLKEKIINTKSDIKFLEGQIEEIPEYNEETRSEEKIKEQLSASKESYNEALGLQAQYKNELERASNNNSKRDVLLVEIESLVKELELLELLVLAFSKNGIPASIIETVLPEIEENANYYLSKMSDNAFELKFATSEIQKNGNEKNTLDITVYDGQIWRGFDSLSGGEGFRVSLSIRLALSKILSKRAGIELESLILDEPCTALDSQGVETFSSVIKSLKSVFPRIILTTHIASLMDEFENKIQLDKQVSGTVVLSN